jgi:hypothetical protein
MPGWKALREIVLKHSSSMPTCTSSTLGKLSSTVSKRRHLRKIFCNAVVGSTQFAR